MIIFPAMDLQNGNCIRLIKGDFNQVKTYSNQPLQIAKEFEKQGASWIHIIDLDGAKTGINNNLSIIQSIAKETSLNIQVGGGIRTESDIDTILSLGVKRVILGTLAVEQISTLENLVNRYQDKIIVSIDSLNGFVMYKGWQDNTSMKTIDFAKQIEQAGIKTIVYTDISKDGLLQGPSITDYELLKQETNLNVIASGGVTTIKDIKTLQKMNQYGAIIGKALYENKITVKEVIACLQEESYLV